MSKSHEESSAFESALAASTPEELEADAREAARLIRSQQEWREAGCPIRSEAEYEDELVSGA